MAFEIIGENLSWVVEHEHSSGFFLVLDYADSQPSFSRELQVISKYNSYDTAQMAIERVRAKGFTMELKAKSLRTTYEIGEGYVEPEQDNR